MTLPSDIRLPWLPALAGRWLIMTRFKRRFIPPRRNQPKLYDAWVHSDYPTYKEKIGHFPSYLFQMSPYEDVWSYRCHVKIPWTDASDLVMRPTGPGPFTYSNLSLDDRRQAVRIRELRKHHRIA